MPQNPLDVEVPKVSPEDHSPPPKPPLQDRVAARWLRIDQAVKYSGINRSRLFRLIADGTLKSAALKDHPHAKRGIRLIDKFSIDSHLEKLCAPLEKRLVHQAQALAQKEGELAKQQAALAKKQREVDKELEVVRNRRLGGTLPTTTTDRKPKPKR